MHKLKTLLPVILHAIPNHAKECMQTLIPQPLARNNMACGRTHIPSQTHLNLLLQHRYTTNIPLHNYLEMFMHRYATPLHKPLFKFLFYHMWGPEWIEICWNSIWLRARSHMTSRYTQGSVTTLNHFGGVLGRPLDIFLFWALTISWARLLACVWSGPKCIWWKWSNLMMLHVTKKVKIGEESPKF